MVHGRGGRLGHSAVRSGGSRGGGAVARSTISLGSNAMSNLVLGSSLRARYNNNNIYHHSPSNNNTTDSTDYKIIDNGCLDYKNRTVRSGDKFATTKDPCFRCVCIDGKPNFCTAAVCGRPGCHNFKEIEDKCCEFECSTGNLLSGLSNFESLDYSDQSASLRHAVSLISGFIVFAAVVYLMQVFRRQKLKSVIDNLRVQQGQRPQLIAINHPCAHMLRRDESDNFFPHVDSLDRQGDSQFHAMEDHNGELPGPPPPYFGETDSRIHSGWKIARIGDGAPFMYAPDDALEPPASSNDPPPSYDQLFKYQQIPPRPNTPPSTKQPEQDIINAHVEHDSTSHSQQDLRRGNEQCQGHP